MLVSSPDGRSPGRVSGLLLLVRRPGRASEEFYLTDGLTIGRSEANAVVLSDCEEAGRAHARVEFAADGTARIRCYEPDASVSADDADVRELLLREGTRFRIGRAAFECVARKMIPTGANVALPQVCPFCGGPVGPTGGVPRPCNRCGEPLLTIPPDTTGTAFVVPVVYGDYRAEGFAARGGMGVVLKGEAEGGSPAVAIKVIPPGQFTDSRAAERLRREAATLERVRHPNVVGFLGHGESGRCPYVVMEWIEGPSLSQAIAEAGREARPPDFAEALPRIESICKGVAAIHAAGLVHRDLKPSNILIDPLGVPRIVDFGISSLSGAAPGSCTTAGNCPGTYEYMAPEQLSAPDSVDGRADLYALGVTFYEYLTGARPVGAWRPASAFNPTVPAWFDGVLGRLLEPDRERRFGDVFELISALSHGRSLPPVAVATARRPWSPWLIGIGLPIFGPAWSGALAALNWWRLSRPRESWRPVALASAAMGLAALADVLAPEEVNRDRVNLLIQTLLLVLLAFTDLRPQWRLYRAHRMAGGRHGRWRVPIVSGIALFVAFEAWAWHDDRAADAYRDGAAFASQGRTDAAIAAYTRAIRHAPDAIDAYYARACAYLEKGEAEKAAADFGRVIQLDPENGNAYHMRGGIFLSRGDLDLALADCNEAVRRAPTEAAAYLKRGMTHFYKDQPDQALRDLEDYVRMEPAAAEGYFWRARVRSSLGQGGMAMADVDHAVSLAPADASYYFARAEMNIQSGRADRALADLDEAIRLAPDDARSLALRVDLHLKKDELGRAIEDADRLVNLRPQDGEVYGLRGRVHAVAGRFEEAGRDADRAVSLDPLSPQFLLIRAVIRQCKGELGPPSRTARSRSNCRPGSHGPTSRVPNATRGWETVSGPTPIAGWPSGSNRRHPNSSDVRPGLEAASRRWSMVHEPSKGVRSHAVGLLLRVRRPDGSVEEFYLADGLTIGRSEANAVVLAGDSLACRSHARVDVDRGGFAQLRCLDPSAFVEAGGAAARELTMGPGIRFRIGPTAFECVPGRAPRGPVAGDACPSCGAADDDPGEDGVRPCSGCGSPMLRVRGRHGDVLLPARYGEYDAERGVARGGSGVVLAGRLSRDGRPVAIKVLLPTPGVAGVDEERFLREVAALAAIRHPGVVGLLSHGRGDHLNFLVTEWVDGPSLAAMIAGHGRAGPVADFADARRWLVDAARGLGAIHAAGLVHRDVKPANILIGQGGRAVVVDLGIARGFDAGEAALTATGLVPGTFAYMAPEQLTSPGSVDARADLFSLGVTFYELLTGSLPAGSWRPASEVNPTVPAPFDAVLERLLRPRPGDRYPDAGALIGACAGPSTPRRTDAPRGRGPMSGRAVPPDSGPAPGRSTPGSGTEPGGPAAGAGSIAPAGDPTVRPADVPRSGRGFTRDLAARGAAFSAARDVVASAIEAAAKTSRTGKGRGKAGAEAGPGRSSPSGATPLTGSTSESARDRARAERVGRSKAKGAVGKPAPPAGAERKRPSWFAQMMYYAIAWALLRHFAPGLMPKWGFPGVSALRPSAAPQQAGPAPNPLRAPSGIDATRQQSRRWFDELRRVPVEKPPENAGPVRPRETGLKLAPSISPPVR